MQKYYSITIDHYSGPSTQTCNTKKEIRPLIKRMQSEICGGRKTPHIYEHTTLNITKELV